MKTQELERALHNQIAKIPKSKLQKALLLLQEIEAEDKAEDSVLDMESWVNELAEIIGDDSVDLSKIKIASREEIYKEIL